MTQEIPKNEKEWQEKLPSEAYEVLRKGKTEAPFSGKFVHTNDGGVYKCFACGNPLFSSKAKFDSSSGWPSFDDVIRENVELDVDMSFGMVRMEVKCKRCGSHLGHVFDDGPTETGKRYCINSVCLDLEKVKEKGEENID